MRIHTVHVEANGHQSPVKTLSPPIIVPGTRVVRTNWRQRPVPSTL